MLCAFTLHLRICILFGRCLDFFCSLVWTNMIFIPDAGLDDLRDWTNNVQPYIPIYVAERDFEVWLNSMHLCINVFWFLSMSSESSHLSMIIKVFSRLIMKIKFFYLTVNMDLTRIVGHTCHKGSLICSSKLLVQTELHFFCKLLQDLLLAKIKENPITLII